MEQKYQNILFVEIKEDDDAEVAEFAQKYRVVALSLLEEVFYRLRKNLPPSNDQEVRALTAEPGGTTTFAIAAVADFLDQSARALPRAPGSEAHRG